MDANWLAMAYQDAMRRRILENQQASQYLQNASFASPMLSMGHPSEPQYDQNNPHLWGLPEVMENSQTMMRGLGGSYRNWIRRRESTKNEMGYGDSLDPRRPMDTGT